MSYVEKYVRPFVREEEIPDDIEDPFFKAVKEAESASL